jgi:hypothetical protein
MRALSLRAAQACEYALNKSCKCRCGGKLHGARRIERVYDELPTRDDFQALPADDPHHLPTDEEIAKARAATRERYRTKRRKRRELVSQLNDATRNLGRWRAWSGPDAPVPQTLTNRIAAIEAELATQ